MFIRKLTSSIVLLLVYVDDIAFSSNDLASINELTRTLRTQFDMKDLGDSKSFLGIEVMRSQRGLEPSATQVYLGVPFTRYAILGGDIVIGDERVAERYHELMSQLNVPFSLEKSLVSSVGALEFAKRFFVRGVTKNLSPVSCRMLRSLVSSISLVSVMRAIMSTDLPLSYRLREAGYRVYT
ncbi:uncharacterized protein LOC114304225 [Camellia sinensis]|uniref:uncharacterized protein LOC114304225 n=1 Tax=Camellia sinensis TaxID=4442 RepID=UPI0010365B71|nr:uncharacterized protein LOC114304225 [Camellia sinensis]